MKAVDARSGGTATIKLRLPKTRLWDDKDKIKFVDAKVGV